jgi:preprotein translocase subunit SecA
VIDRRWRDHLYEMDYLKDGIGLRAMAQRDPLVEYQREGFAMYQTMMGQIREETIGFLFNLEVEVTQGGTTAAAPIVAAKGLTGNTTPATKLSYSAPAEAGGVEVRNQRGQLDQASTAKAQKAADAVSPAFKPQPGKTAQAEQPAARGAFGQNTGGGGAAPINRAERRAQEKRAKK